MADSTIEVEYVITLEATKESIWIRMCVSKLGLVLSASNALGLYCDNNGAITYAKEPESHKNLSI
jgi:hypothetical protein